MEEGFFSGGFTLERLVKKGLKGMSEPVVFKKGNQEALRGEKEKNISSLGVEYICGEFRTGNVINPWKTYWGNTGEKNFEKE